MVDIEPVKKAKVMFSRFVSHLDMLEYFIFCMAGTPTLVLADPVNLFNLASIK